MSGTSDPKSNAPDLQDNLTRIQREFYATIIARLEGGKATHQELTLAHKVLQEAGLTWKPDDDEEQKRLVDKAKEGMPEFPDADDGDDEG